MLVKTNNNNYHLEINKGLFYLHPELLNQIQSKHPDVNYYSTKLDILNKNNHFGSHKLEFDGRFNKDILSKAIANTLCIDFEVTERCNLNCYYCSYGKFYNNRDLRKNKDIDIDQAISFLEYIVSHLNSSYNTLAYSPIYIGFYGGEPLLNFKAVETITEYSKKIKLKNGNFFKYLMTTNGVLLDKHAAFLEKNDFLLTISLDGNVKHNGFRTFHDGKESFKLIYDNIKKLQIKYPNYFISRVNFNAVLHEKNNVEDVTTFYQKEFSKMPKLSYVSETGLDDEFLKEYNDRLLKKRKQIHKMRTAHQLLRNYGNVVRDEYYELFLNQESSSVIPTGTCIPFSRRCYLSVNGKILPCEKIGHEHALGNIDDQGIHLDLEKATNVLNTYYDKIKTQCKGCIKLLNCSKCIFCLPIKNETPICDGPQLRDFFLVERNEALEQFESNNRYTKFLIEEYNEI